MKRSFFRETDTRDRPTIAVARGVIGSPAILVYVWPYRERGA